jgi:hypothetical protein
MASLAGNLRARFDGALRGMTEGRLGSVDRVLGKLVNSVEIEKHRRASRARAVQRRTRTPALGTWIFEERAPWSDETLIDVQVPGMITDEEARYYQYIGAQFTGAGDAVELGPWLGRSTQFIVEGLSRSAAFAGRKLHVSDDFVWRPDWMDKYVTPEQRLPRHADFLPLFEHFNGRIADRIVTRKRRFTVYDGNDAVPQFEWSEGPVEIVYADCGRTFVANDAWYSRLRPHFVPGVTLLVLQDWGTQLEVPRKGMNQMAAFAATYANELALVHWLRDGAVGTFLYTGT